MTIRFTKPWNGYYEDQVVALEGAEETRLIGLGYAVADLDGPDNNLTEVKVQANVDGSKSLIAADGTEYPLSNRNVTSLRLAATPTDGLASGAVVPFDTVTIDDQGNYAGTAGRILIPTGTKRYRVKANVSLTTASTGGDWRRLAHTQTFNSSSSPVNVMGVRTKTFPVVTGYTQTMDLDYDSGLLDISAITFGAAGTNYIELVLSHNATATIGATANSVAPMIYSSINVEFYD